MRSILLGGLGIGVATIGVLAANDAAVNEVLKLQKAGLAGEVIVNYVQSKPVDYSLTADDIVRLRDQGLGVDVLNAMLQVSTQAQPAAPTVAPQPVAAPAASQVLAPATPAVPATATFVTPSATVVGTPATVVTTPATVVLSPSANPESAYFYQELRPYGNWILTEDNAWYWQPTVARADLDWRPYWDRGHWVYTDSGWYWSSDYPWGWVAFHYGRWSLHPRYGWIWYPGREWGPAWVTWRSGGDYCGWAPLPPHTRFDSVGGRYVYRGRAVEVGFDFGLDFHHFSFCLTRELGDSSRRRVSRESDIRAVFGRTVVVNNYTVVTVNQERRVVNRGIEPTRIVEHGGRSVTKVVIHDIQTPRGRDATERFDSRNHTLEVYRPRWGGDAPGQRSSAPAVTRSPSPSPSSGAPGRSSQPAGRGHDDRPGSGGPGRR